MHRPSVQAILTGLVLMAAVALRVADPEPVARLRLSVFDAYQRASPRVPDPAQTAVVVDIDEASLERLGQWPWPRARLAEIVDKIRAAGARTLSLDLILAEPDRLSPEALAKAFAGDPEFSALVQRAGSLASNDERLAIALSRFPVALGVSGELNRRDAAPTPRASFASAGDDARQFTPRFPGAATPLPVLAARAAGLGAVNWLPSSDQIVRRVPLLLTIGDQLYPSLALEQFRLARGETTLFVRASGASGILSFGQHAGIDSITVGPALIPAGGDGQMWLHFARLDPARYIPAHSLLDGSADPARLAGRHVIIGASATGLLDLRATPLDASVPGVEIHAQALEHMLTGIALERPAWATGAEIVFLLLSGGLVAWLIGRSGPAIAAAIGAGAIFGVTALSWNAFGHGLLFDPVYPSIALVALYLAGSLTSYLKAEADRMRIRFAFGHYLAAPLVEELARDPSRLKLGGEMREVTVLFTDVRGFSKLSEGMDAEQLIGFINTLFTPFSEVIIDHRGTIDKFMGDGIMAFWNAPADVPGHATHSCRAALGLMARLDELNAERRTEAEAVGHSAPPVRIGIGINTGPCVAGNVGSPQQLNYSIMGEAVNIAARLEEATKTYGVPIIVGEATAHAATGLAFLDIGQITPRGKSRPEHIFALLGDADVAASARFLDLNANHAALMAALATGDRKTARSRLAACRALDWPELNALFDHFEAAIPAGPA